ncbi:type IV toxin-antitoxin system AbiEi family antitoxin domain-containing protein [Mollicutes bacterium LVI A0039]|nr:type IV toxin-antitoxin system AbiEi family antitoxin domain-containing protein [Mollicutes bacterium LVI A0039]
MDGLYKLLNDNNGIVTTGELREFKFDSRSIKQLVESSVIESVVRGIYVGVEYFVDNLYNAVKMYKRCIFI